MERKEKYFNTQTEVGSKIIMPFVSDISNKIISSLQSKTLEDLYLKVKHININKNKKIDFTI